MLKSVLTARCECPAGQLRFRQTWKRHAGAQLLTGRVRPLTRNHPPTSDSQTTANCYLPSDLSTHIQFIYLHCISIYLTHHFRVILFLFLCSQQSFLKQRKADYASSLLAGRLMSVSAPCCTGRRYNTWTNRGQQQRRHYRLIFPNSDLEVGCHLNLRL